MEEMPHQISLVNTVTAWDQKHFLERVAKRVRELKDHR